MYPEINILGLSIQTYLLLNILAIICVVLPLYHELIRNTYSRKTSFGLILSSLSVGLIGNKVYGILEIWDEFIPNPFETFFFYAGSGWFGGLIGGFLGATIYIRINKLHFLKTTDIIFKYIPLGQAVGRLGCFLSGDGCYGYPSNISWAMAFPNGLVPTKVRVHPTPLYEIMVCVAAFIILIYISKKRYPEGLQTSFYLIFVDLGRFFVEFFRTNTKVILALTAPQIISLMGIAIGAIVLYKIVVEYSSGNELSTSTIKRSSKSFYLKK